MPKHPELRLSGTEKDPDFDTRRDNPDVIPFPTPVEEPDQDIESHDVIVDHIEQTLDRMQDRLDVFKKQLDKTFKFPGVEDRNDNNDDDDLPPAA